MNAKRRAGIHKENRPVCAPTVLSGEAWVDRLLDLIRELHARKFPIFGACFGQQAVALAFGGAVEKNPGGYVAGLNDLKVVERPPWAKNLGDDLRRYGVHSEQVTRMPEGARVLVSSDACEVAGMAIGDCIYTTQYHLEITHEFATAVVEEFKAKFPEDALTKAKESFARRADQSACAETIARFFEAANTVP